MNVCLWCGRTSPEREKELSEKLNKENTPANPTQIPDEEIVMKEYTLTRTVDIMMAEAEFSVSVLDCYGEWIMATPTYEARLIEDKEFLSSPGFNYDIKVTNSTAYIEDKHLYLEVEFDITATFGISIDCFELAIELEVTCITTDFSKTTEKSVRVVDSPKDKLDDEYIVAMKTSTIVIPSIGVADYHFAVQLSDGSWADKPGQTPSRWNVLDGTAIAWDLGNIKNYYNTKTVYFAVER